MSEPDKKINKILESETKAAEDSQGVLTRLWRNILKDCRVMPATWARLMTNYLNDPRNGIPAEGKKRSSDRNNLNKEVARLDMTWNVFFKGLKVLGVQRFKIEITLEWKGRDPTVHTLIKKVSNTNEPIETQTNNGEVTNDTTTK
jgi:hypothetical protein